MRTQKKARYSLLSTLLEAIPGKVKFSFKLHLRMSRSYVVLVESIDYMASFNRQLEYDVLFLLVLS